MIRVLLTETGLTPAITIKTAVLATVSTGVMTEIGPSNDGRFWYGYTYNGTPGAEYLIEIDAGSSITDPELRYISVWDQEEYTPTDIATQVETAILTEGDGKAVLQAIADKIGNENVSAAVIASAVRTELTLELSRIDAAISSISGGGGGDSTGGVGFYMSGGGGVDTKGIEKKFTDIMTELKKEPEKYTKALETAQKQIVNTVKKIPQPIINVTPTDVKVELPPKFLEEIRSVVTKFNQDAEGKTNAIDEAYTIILKRFRENIAEDIKGAVRNDQSSFDSVIESAILRATNEFTQALSNITLIEEE